MVGVGGAVSSLLSLGGKLLLAVNGSGQIDEDHGIEDDLDRLMKTAERIKATLYDAEEREIRDESFKLWVKELKAVAAAAEDVLDDYHYEVLRSKVESRDAIASSSCKGKLVQVPDGMAERIKKITREFNDIAHDRRALRLFKEDGARRCDAPIVPTSHMVADSGIFGRQTEKSDLVNLLCSDSDGDGSNNSFSVVTVVGTGGIGKTTLAQLVYKDPRIQQTFDQFGWIHVSESFDVERLTREAIESISEIGCDLRNFSGLQKKLGEVVREKKLFLVLDDVWNDSRSLWESFRIPLMLAKLVKILVTTRHEPVTRIMPSVTTFDIGYLSEEECWQLFQYYAFDEVNHNRKSPFLELGKEIMKKCGKLPLAVKSVASLLRHEADEKIWNEILESEIWQRWDVSDEILRPLQISYSRLPTHLKPCFLFCSIFPKNYEFKIEELAQFWFAHGYIGSIEGKSTEEIASEYAKQLWQRSFFDYWHVDSEFQSSIFKLHDMIHELAIINGADECYSFQAGKIQAAPKKIFHLRVGCNTELVKVLPAGSCKGLRTLLVGDRVEKFSATSLSEVKTLRVLEFKSGCCDLQLFCTAENMKHLRYLKLELFSFEKLPESIGLLYNLQYLTLSKCSDLFELPNSISNLMNLRFLFLSHCCKFNSLPECMRNLLGLEKLILNSCGIKALPASLCQLTAMREIVLTDCRNLSELPLDLGNLTSLQTLIVKTTGIRYLPRSLNNIIGLEKLVLSYEGDG